MSNQSLEKMIADLRAVHADSSHLKMKNSILKTKNKELTAEKDQWKKLYLSRRNHEDMKKQREKLQSEFQNGLQKSILKESEKLKEANRQWKSAYEALQKKLKAMKKENEEIKTEKDELESEFEELQEEHALLVDYVADLEEKYEELKGKPAGTPDINVQNIKNEATENVPIRTVHKIPATVKQENVTIPNPIENSIEAQRPKVRVKSLFKRRVCIH